MFPKQAPPAVIWYLRVLAFMGAFAILITIVARYYLFPAMEAAAHATPGDRKVLRAHAALLLALILFIVMVGWMLTFRVGRYFFPRPAKPKRPPTNYPDAWAESARRIQVDDEE